MKHNPSIRTDYRNGKIRFYFSSNPQARLYRYILVEALSQFFGDSMTWGDDYITISLPEWFKDEAEIECGVEFPADETKES